LAAAERPAYLPSCSLTPREAGHRLGQFFNIIGHEKERLDSVFHRNILDVTDLKTSIRAHIPRRYNRVLGAAKIFSPSVLVTHQWVAQPLLRREEIVATLGSVTPKLHEHSSDHV
jgi:hypothetical protein